jgi:D-glycero-alpha-D-manno-heptose 1-phosphate guanylyltransferase
VTTCIVLAGGLGTRLRPVLSDRPKCLAPVGDSNVLALQMDALARRGVTRFVLALGHLAPAVLAAVEPLRARFAIEAVVEPQALGTGGALLHAMAECGLGECLAANGDTWLDAELGALLRPLDLAGGERVRMGCAVVDDASRYGAVRIGAGGRVEGFAPRGRPGGALINAGLYRLHRSIFDGQRAGTSFSLEAEVLPALAADGSLRAVPLPGGFIDIGVPDDYRRFCERQA